MDAPYVVAWKRFTAEKPVAARVIWIYHPAVGVHPVPVWSIVTVGEGFWTHWAYASFDLPAGPGGQE